MCQNEHTSVNSVVNQLIDWIEYIKNTFNEEYLTQIRDTVFPLIAVYTPALLDYFDYITSLEKNKIYLPMTFQNQ